MNCQPTARSSDKRTANFWTMTGWWLVTSATLFSGLSAAEPPLAWELGPTGTKASLRAISVPGDLIIWAAGSGGTIIRSEDGGSSWQNCSPRGYESVEFRALHAWDEREACVASAGTPAVILRTRNGGLDWQVAYQNAAPEAFFDGLKFWGDQLAGTQPPATKPPATEQHNSGHGIAFSDPVAGGWLVVETHDHGISWSAIPADQLPPAVAGEAAFAASNSAMCVGKQGAVWIGTGGVEREESRILYRSAATATWQTALCPLPSNASSGVFAILTAGKRKLIAVGGDYRPDMESKATAAISLDLGATWQLAEVQPASFRSAVVALPQKLLAAAELSPPAAAYITTGPEGTDVSVDGLRWESLSTVGFHAMERSSQTVFAVGSNGRFAKLVRKQE